MCELLLELSYSDVLGLRNAFAHLQVFKTGAKRLKGPAFRQIIKQVPQSALTCENDIILVLQVYNKIFDVDSSFTHSQMGLGQNNK